MTAIYSVILAGGAGSRLWPLSRETYPKQMFKLDDEYTLFQKTFLRVASLIDDKNIITSTNVKHSSAINEQLKELKEKFCRKSNYKVITEPLIKNTAPALLLASKYIEKISYSGSDTIILAVPSDHYIPDRLEFAKLIEKGIKLAKEGYIVSFSQKSDKADENYGCMKVRKNPKISAIEPEALKVNSFIEKPNTKNNLKGKIYINTGLYMFSAKTYFNEAEKYIPEMCKLLENEEISNTIPSVSMNVYSKMPEISVDYALMEKTKQLVTIPFETNWKDIGSWDAVYEISDKDENGNYITGKIVDIDSKNSLIYSTSKIVATLGLKDAIVVETEDAVLVSSKKDTSGIKKIYKKLNGKNTSAKEIHKTVFRPWGCYTVLEEGKGFLTKCIIVNPGAKLSLQFHHHRSEHWIVLEGEATVIKGDNTYTLEAGNSIDIACKEVHSLQNHGSDQLKILEVQQGDILEENDIIRLQDIYGRV